VRSSTTVLAALNKKRLAFFAVGGAIEAYNYFPTAFWRRGQLPMSLGRIDEGQHWLERAFRETYQPGEASAACIDLGNALWTATQHRRALEAFRRCASLPLDDSSRAEIDDALAKLTQSAENDGRW
jgi:tetratricopeptide (TPR) repeat protein